MKKVIRWPLRMIGAFLMIRGLIALLADRPEIQSRALQFNKRVLNPMMLRLAGRKCSPYGAIHHMGRRSGRAYTTPVVVEAKGDNFLVALVYGTGTDWYRNIMAAGGCTLTWHGQEYTLVEPELLTLKAAKPMLIPARAFGLQLFGVKQYLRMRRPAEVPEKVAIATS